MTPANYGFFLTRWDIGSATCSAAGSENYKHEVAEEAKDRSSLDLLYWPIVNHLYRDKSSRLTSHSAASVSLARGSIFLANDNHSFKLVYTNFLDIVLTSIESSAGLMCACLPLTKPVILRFARWLQGLHALETEDRDLDTLSQSSRSSIWGKGAILSTKDCHVQALRLSQVAHPQTENLV